MDVVNGSNGVASTSANDSTETVKKVMKKLVEANKHDRIFEKVNSNLYLILHILF